MSFANVRILDLVKTHKMQDMKIPKNKIPDRNIEGKMCENYGVGLSVGMLETASLRVSKREMWEVLNVSVNK